MSNADRNVRKSDIQFRDILSELRGRPLQLIFRLRQVSFDIWRGKFHASESLLTIEPMKDKK